MENLKYKSKYSFILKTFLLSLFVFIMGIFFISLKENLDIDETFTYGLANSSFQLDIEDFKEYNGNDLLLNYTSVKQDNKFDIANLYFNQKMDTHPPLYYMLVNFISSINSGNFSMWYGLIINAFFLIFVFWEMQYLFNLILKNKIVSIILTLISFFTYGFINEIVFTRMYVCLTTFSLAFIILIIKKLKNEINDILFLILFFVNCVLGILTQYHFMLTACFFSIYFAVIIIIRKYRLYKTNRTGELCESLSLRSHSSRLRFLHIQKLCEPNRMGELCEPLSLHSHSSRLRFLHIQKLCEPNRTGELCEPFSLRSHSSRLRFLHIQKLCEPNVKILLLTIITGILSIITSIAIFPAMLQHLFGAGSLHAINNPDTASSISDNFINMADTLRLAFFGNAYIIYGIIFIILIIISLIFNKKNNFKKTKYIDPLLFTFMIYILFYFVIISLTIKLSFARYLYNIYPIIIIVIVGLINNILQSINPKLAILTILFLLSFCITSNLEKLPTSLNIGDNEFRQFLNENKNTKTIILYRSLDYMGNPNSMSGTSLWKLPYTLYLFKDLQNITYVDTSDIEVLKNSTIDTISNHDDIFLVIFTANYQDDQNLISEIIKKNNVWQAQKMYFTSYIHVYRLQ